MISWGSERGTLSWPFDLGRPSTHRKYSSHLISLLAGNWISNDSAVVRAGDAMFSNLCQPMNGDVGSEWCWSLVRADGDWRTQ